LKPVDDKNLTPIDPNVRVPDHVSAASAAADALHQQFYPKDPGQAAAPAKEALPQPDAPEPLHTPSEQQQQADPALQTQATPQQLEPQQQVIPPVSDADKNVDAEGWRHRFLSMQGRFNQAQRDKGAMEQQMQDLGQELVRTQNLLASVQSPPHATQSGSSGHGHNNLITAEDVESYGPELLDVVSRAARGAVSGELEQLREQNKELTQRVQNTGKRELFSTLDRAVPNWREINKSPQFITWLRLPNVYTGALRGNMLKAAVDGAKAPQVIALFKDFLAEAHATGSQVPAAQIEQPAAQQLVPRTPALSLDTLAAPGKARPASGDGQVPVEKPTYTREQIRKLYDDKRRGMYAGREAEFAAFEADLTAAQRDGRIR